jgi:hypothetical protein
VSSPGEPSAAPVRRGQPVAEKISPWPFVGMAGMACTFFLNAASGLLAPLWGVAVLLGIWFALLLLGFRWWTPHPVRLALLPVVSLLLWFGIVIAGDVWLNWTA